MTPHKLLLPDLYFMRRRFLLLSISCLAVAARTHAFFLSSASSSIPSPHRQWQGFSAAEATQQDRELLPVEVVSEMPPPLPAPLKHQYYLLRHGQSTANVAEIISSARSLAYTDKHGLTALGREQARQTAATQLLQVLSEMTEPGDTVVFVSSPLARARETAAEARLGLLELMALDPSSSLQDVTIAPEIVLKDRLCERYFGRLDAQALYTYAYVWPLDKLNVTHTAFGVESVAAVCTRLRHVIVEELETEFGGGGGENDGTFHLVLSSHADVLQIAQLYAALPENDNEAALNVGTFSSFRFQNGEVRQMKVGSGASQLPPAAPLAAPQRGTHQYTSATWEELSDLLDL